MRNAGLIAFGMLMGVLLAIGYQGHAQTWMVGSGFVRHLSGEKHCHDKFTPGVGIEHKLRGNWDLAAGLYSNSNCNTSAYAAVFNKPLHLGQVRLGWFAGGVTGYANSVMPVAGLGGSFEAKTWGLNLIYIPPYEDTGNVLWLQVKRTF